ncbi:hypothetical protein EVAR_48686_1 [Eumeta japonica]|uniref:Uncharacterized protein n=1 Tax=Eumeta variegata TaxID=151549 RepID=A0A4C1XBN0_EUMVA|nr:hypothetical protein EVAR_48686_1 [Eumeta japonica]
MDKAEVKLTVQNVLLWQHRHLNFDSPRPPFIPAPANLRRDSIDRSLRPRPHNRPRPGSTHSQTEDNFRNADIQRKGREEMVPTNATVATPSQLTACSRRAPRFLRVQFVNRFIGHAFRIYIPRVGLLFEHGGAAWREIGADSLACHAAELMMEAIALLNG